MVAYAIPGERAKDLQEPTRNTHLAHSFSVAIKLPIPSADNSLDDNCRRPSAIQDKNLELGIGSSLVITEVKKTQRTEKTNRSIPSLDGLRAVSVFAVILGHTRSALFDRIPFNAVFRHGGLGVAVFFVISGFLITHLLMK
jgi:hypothetical protein